MHGIKMLPKSIEDTIRLVDRYAAERKQTSRQANNIGTTAGVACVQAGMEVNNMGVEDNEDKQSPGVAMA